MPVPRDRNLDAARLSKPPSAVSDTLGKNCARATLMLALAETSCASASRTSGRRASSSDGSPGATDGANNGASERAASFTSSGGSTSRIASASSIWASCCSSGGMAARSPATTVSCWASSRSAAVPIRRRPRMIASTSSALARLSRAICSRSCRPSAWKYVVATLETAQGDDLLVVAAGNGRGLGGGQCRSVLAPKIDLVGGADRRRVGRVVDLPIWRKWRCDLLRRGAARGLDRRQQRGAGDARLGVGFLDPCGRRPEIGVGPLRLGHQRVELGRPESLPPVRRRPLSALRGVAFAPSGGRRGLRVPIVGTEVASAERHGGGHESNRARASHRAPAHGDRVAPLLWISTRLPSARLTVGLRTTRSPLVTPSLASTSVPRSRTTVIFLMWTLPSSTAATCRPSRLKMMAAPGTTKDGDRRGILSSTVQ